MNGRPQVRWTTALVVAIHALWGVLLLAYPTVVFNITAINYMSHFLGPKLAGVLYLAACVLSFISLYYKNKWHRLVGVSLLLPQQFLLWVSALGAWSAIVNQSFADGIKRPWAFLAADQGPYILLAIFYTIAILQIYAPEILRFSKKDALK